MGRTFVTLAPTSAKWDKFFFKIKKTTENATHRYLLDTTKFGVLLRWVLRYTNMHLAVQRLWQVATYKFRCEMSDHYRHGNSLGCSLMICF